MNAKKIWVLVFAASFVNLSNSFALSLDPVQFKNFANNDKIPLIVKFKNKIHLEKQPGRLFEERPCLVSGELEENLSQNQKNIIHFLVKNRCTNIKSLWIINGISLSLPRNLLEKLSEFEEICSIEIDHHIELMTFGSASNKASNKSGLSNIELIGAKELWEMGYTGRNVTIAVMDSGVDVKHPALAKKWRGGDNSWFDPYGEYDAPGDIMGHGTQALGVILGSLDDEPAIGIAPDAKWIAVKIFNDNYQASVSCVHRGFQWLLDPDGDPNTDDAPDIVNVSWGYSGDSDKCITEFEDDINVLKDAGIAVVFAAGNKGPLAHTSVSPANNSGSFAVGAGGIDPSHTYEKLSSRGPSSCDNTIYPEVVAPGVDIRTTDISRNGKLPGYINTGGTSIAAPHVTGCMALLLSAFPELRVSELESVLKESAIDIGTPGPDNTYGHGLINVLHAYNKLSKTGYNENNNLEASMNATSFAGFEADLHYHRNIEMVDLALMASNWLKNDFVN